MKNREPIWWIPLARRILIWGALSGLVVGALFFVLATSLFLLPNIKDPSDLQDMGFWVCLLNAMKTGIIFGMPFCAVGPIIGCTAGLCAPPREPKNLFASLFFRRVLANVLIFWPLSSFVFAFLLAFASIVIDPWPSSLSSENWLYVAAFVTFVPSLWRAINRALAAAKLK